jgi:hypothetical protein
MNFSSSIALADVGIPMIVIEWPLMLMAMVPVIILEALLIRRWVSLSYRDAFKGTTAANVVSTLAGVPLSWLMMLAVEYAVGLPMDIAADKLHLNVDGPVFRVVSMLVSVAWIGGEDASMKWIIPACIAILLVPCFFLSVWIESKVCLGIWKNLDRETVRRGVFRSNLASYTALLVLTCSWVGFGYFASKH